MASMAAGTVSRSSATIAPEDQRGLALAVADVGWVTTENLFRELGGDSTRILLLKCHDYLNGWRRGLFPWSDVCRLQRRCPSVWEQQMVLPSGWMKRYPRVGMRPIARNIRRWWQNRPEGWRSGLVMTYPHYRYLRDQLEPDVSVYYNIDDYRLYWPRHTEAIGRLEIETVRKADLTICVSELRARELTDWVPEAACRIHHVGHGAPEAFLTPQPMHRPGPAPEDLRDAPGPLLGYVGSMEDRVDWNLMNRVAEAFPKATIVVVGRVGPPREAPWWADCARFLARPNVRAVGWRSQEALASYYQAFDVSLIPYRLDHPFNRACNPTKIMDAMASGRPIVATAIPECRLHTERFDVSETGDAFVAAIGRILAMGSDDGRAAIRHSYAVANSCTRVAHRILAMIQAVS